ncbi:hypothetical protein BASA50_000490 [Batrachochytrium salamandrivorans]|uniref:non-specific serine/threonine protein kinase n=1 Tax=Batrachochytrium salamandrivorans TaxID=1357716 RepID=A0ABQ8EU40_9FUNG|nr:hypothetical protein BASA50_000490 [Batrachochytrium salamandrivorans]
MIVPIGSPTNGDTDDDDSVDQAPKSKPNPKKATSSLQRANSLRLPKALRRLEAPYQRSTSAPADLQLDEECTGAHWMKVLSKPCPRQPSQPGSQTSTLHALSQSGEMPPTYLSKSEVESYRRGQKTDQYTAFIESEENYFTSTYSPKKKLGQGKYGRVYLATRNSDGLKVAYKSISKRDVEKYALESSPPPICNLRNSPVRSKKPSVAQCMSSRPPNLLLPHEFLLQTYLSQPSHDNPYVPMTFDYIALKDVFILVMEYFDGKWMSLSKYVRERGRLDISDVRNIGRKVVNAMLFLKQYGVVHDDLHGKIKLIDFGRSGIAPKWKDGKSVPSKSSDPSSPVAGYRAGPDELRTHPFAYFVVECEQVTGHRIQSGLVPEIQKSRLRLLGRALDPGVENVYTWLRGGVLNGEADLDQLWLDGDCEA